ncbi:MAG: DUF3667 domain-containing protein [Flavobacteriaceae bacterium]
MTTTKYCAYCGQRSSVHKVTMKETFEDLADNLFSISAPLVITIKNLVVDPGKLFREYLGGKRKKYYKPVSFFILTTAVYLFLRWAIGFEIRGEINLDQSTIEQVDPDTLTQARDFMFQNINSLAFFFVLTMSLMLKAFFYRKYMFTEYVAVSFYLNGIYSILATLNIFYIKFINQKIQYLAILFMGVYFVYAMIRLFQDRPFWVSIKSILVFFFAYAGYIFLAFSFSYLIVILK